MQTKLEARPDMKHTKQRSWLGYCGGGCCGSRLSRNRDQSWLPHCCTGRCSGSASADVAFSAPGCRSGTGVGAAMDAAPSSTGMPGPPSSCRSSSVAGALPGLQRWQVQRCPERQTAIRRSTCPPSTAAAAAHQTLSHQPRQALLLAGWGCRAAWQATAGRQQLLQPHTGPWRLLDRL